MKYVIIKMEKAGIKREVPIIFPNDLAHSDVFDALSACCAGLKGGEAVAAGEFSSLALETARPGGMSTSLNLQSREKDKRLMMLMDYNFGLDL